MSRSSPHTGLGVSSRLQRRALAGRQRGREHVVYVSALRATQVVRFSAVVARHVKILTVEEAVARELAADPLGDYHVDWDEVDKRDVRGFRRALGQARAELDMQAYLAGHPELLIQHLGGGHGRWVIPQKRLGAEYVPDFVIGERNSSGRHWTAVELESPQRPMFNKAGDPSRYLWHAIRQIVDWRVWLEHNRDYAARDPCDDGLGLEDISPGLPGLIIIGRRQDLPARRQAFRRGLERQLNVHIHSFDWLLQQLEGRVKSLASWREREEQARQAQPRRKSVSGRRR